MNARCGLPIVLRCLLAALALSCLTAAAHTLPVSYLRLVPNADYLHLELVFNPFELTFMAELDDNQDAELSLAELEAHGPAMANRVAEALALSAGGTTLRPESAGMDPDLSGHHVRLRAHYKVDARRRTLSLESNLDALTSASHLTQVTYANGPHTQLAQLDAHSRRVTFEPPPPPKPASPPPTADGRAAFGLFLWLLAIIALLTVVVGVLLLVRRRMQQ